MNYTVLSSSVDEDAWHSDRAKGVTASEVALLESGGPKAWQNLRDTKAGIKTRFEGNEYTRWGHEREPHILAFLENEYGIEPNNNVLAHPDHPEYMATPDGIGTDGLSIGEAKTSKADRWETVPKKYVSQVQWGMFVTGAQVCFLAVEYYAVTGSGLLVTRYFEDPEVWTIHRDEEHISRLRGIADKFLHPQESPLDELLTMYVKHQKELDRIKSYQDAVKTDLMNHMAACGVSKHVVEGVGSVSYTAPTEPKMGFELEKFKESHKDLFDQFYLPGTVPKPSVRVTPVKEK